MTLDIPFRCLSAGSPEASHENVAVPLDMKGHAACVR